MRISPFLLTFMLAACAAASADTIHLRSGQSIEGEVLSRGEGRVRVRSRGTEYRFNEADITSIEESPAWKSHLLEAEGSIVAGDALGGIERVREAMRGDADPVEVQHAIERTQARLLAEVPTVGAADAPAVRAGLNDIATADSSTTTTRVLVARVMIEAGAQEQAFAVARRAGRAGLESVPDAMGWIVRALQADIRARTGAAEYDAAIERILLLEELTGAPRDSHLPLVYLVRAAVARERGDYRAAMLILCGDLAPLKPEIARNRAGLVVHDLIERANRDGEFSQAFVALGPLERSFPIEYHLARRELAMSHARRALDRGAAAEAYSAIAALPEEDRTADAMALMLEADFQKRLAVLDPNDPFALYNLARWCATQELYDRALELLIKVRANPALRETVEREQAVIQDQRDLRLLDEATKLYDKGLLREVGDKLAPIIDGPPRPSQVRDDAVRLNTLAKRDMETEDKRRPYLAEVAYQQAERAFFTSDLDGTLEILQMILNQYGDTPAAKRAQLLLPDVVHNLQISMVE